MNNILKKSATIIMSLMLMLSNGTVAVNAAPGEQQASLTGLDVTITQNIDNTIVEIVDPLVDIINSEYPVSLGFTFGIPVLGDIYGDNINALYFEQGDSTSFLVSSGFNVTSGMGNFVLEFEGVVIGYLYLENVVDTSDQPTGEVRAVIVFDNYVDVDDDTNNITVDPTVFDGSYEKVSIVFNTTLQYDDSNAGIDGGQYDVVLLDKTFKVEVPPVPTIVTSTKEGTINGLYVDWVVTYNVTRDSSHIVLDDYTFLDDLSAAGDFETGTFKINDSLTYDVDGTPFTYEDNLSISAEHLMTYNLDGLDSPIKISYQTKVSDTNYYSVDDIEFTNISYLNKLDTLVPNSTKEKTVLFEKDWIVKGGALTDYNYTAEAPDEPSATMVWTIEANSLGASLNDVHIIDVINENLIVSDARYYIGDSDIPAIVWSDLTAGELLLDTAVTTLNPLSDIARDTNTGFTGGDYFLGDVNDKIKIILTTNAIWDAENYDFGHNEYTVDNSATITWTNNGGGTVSSTGVDIGFGINPIKKVVASSDKSNHTINWNVTVSQSNVNSNLRVLDLLVYGDSLNVDNIDSITNTDLAVDDLEYVSLDFLKNNLVLPVNSDIKNIIPQYNQRYYDSANTGTAKITVHTIKNASGVAIADLIVMTEDGLGIDVTGGDKSFSFQSQLTNPDHYASNATTTIINTATLFSGDIKLNSVNRSYDYISNMLEKDMLKVGDAIAFDADSARPTEAFDYIDKSIIFRLTINSNELSSLNDYTNLTNIKVTDTLPDGWNIVDITSGNKFLIYDGNGNDLTATSVDETTGFLTVSFVDATDTENSKAIFEFSDLDKEYVVLIKAQLDENTAIEYFDDNTTDAINNLSSFEADEVTISVADTQSISIASKIISKDYSDDTDGELLWSIEYKPYELEFIGVEIDDVLPVGLDLRTNSLGELDLSDGNFSITKLLLDMDGTYSDDGTVDVVVDDNIKYDNETRTLTFIIPETGQAYRFNYLTDINADTGVSLTNSVSLKNAGGSVGSVLSAYTVAQSDVSATMSRSGWVKITKENNNFVALQYAQFGIYTVDGSTLFRSGTTSSTGELTLRGLPVGNYILKEIEAPAGYKKSTKVYTVVVTTSNGVVTTSINGQTGIESNFITFINFETGDTGDLKISKKLFGSAPDYTKDFIFTIEISDLNETFDYIGSGGKENYTITFVNGKASFTLRGGQSILIQYLPRDVAYTITENDYYGDPADRYSTTSINETGTIIVDDTVNVTFTNQKHALIYEDYGTLPATGDDFPTNTLLLLFGISLLGAVTLLLLRKIKFGN